MKRFLFLSSFIITGLISSYSFADSPKAPKAVNTSGPSPEQITNEISKLHSESNKYLLDHADKDDSHSSPPQIIDETASSGGHSAGMNPPANTAIPNPDKPKPPIKPQNPASTSSINNDSGNGQYQSSGTSQQPPQNATTGGDNSGSKNSNWNMGY